MEHDVVGGYRLERRPGSGAMGQVWLGRHERTHGTAAVKLLRARPRGTDQLRAFFNREGRAIARLAHPHIVPLFDMGDDYLVTEHVSGSDLRRMLRTPVDPARAVRIALQLFRACFLDIAPLLLAADHHADRRARIGSGDGRVGRRGARGRGRDRRWTRLGARDQAGERYEESDHRPIMAGRSFFQPTAAPGHP